MFSQSIFYKLQFKVNVICYLQSICSLSYKESFLTISPYCSFEIWWRLLAAYLNMCSTIFWLILGRNYCERIKIIFCNLYKRDHLINIWSLRYKQKFVIIPRGILNEKKHIHLCPFHFLIELNSKFMFAYQHIHYTKKAFVFTSYKSGKSKEINIKAEINKIKKHKSKERSQNLIV